MAEPRILVVDDEPDMVDHRTRILGRAGHRCLSATDPHRALALLESERPDLLLTDLKMPGIDGLALLRRARELDPTLPVVVITAFATIESAVAAIKDGAFDYLPKNFSVDQLTLVLERALRQRRPGGAGRREPQTRRAAAEALPARERRGHESGHAAGVRAREEGGALGGQHP